MSDSTSNRRLPELDILRGVAVLCVLMAHIPSVIMESGYSFVPLLEWMRLRSWFSVDLFFLLSGFLISGLLFREYQKFGSVRGLTFLARRGFKIYPAFYVLFLTTFVIDILLLGRFGEAAGMRTVSELLYIQNYTPGLWPHTWTLAVEEHFYLLLIILFSCLIATKAGGTNPFRSLPRIVAGVAALSLLARSYLVLTVWPFDLYTHHFPTHLRCDTLLTGVLLSYWYHFHRSRFVQTVRAWRRGIFVMVLCALIPLLVYPPITNRFIESGGFTLAALLHAGVLSLLLVWEGSGKDRFVQLARPIAWVGTISYSVYLWHVSLDRWGIVLVEQLFHVTYPAWFAAILYFGGSIALGSFMANRIEFPFLKIRDRLIPSRIGSANIAAHSASSSEAELNQNLLDGVSLSDGSDAGSDGSLRNSPGTPELA